MGKTSIGQMLPYQDWLEPGFRKMVNNATGDNSIRGIPGARGDFRRSSSDWHFFGCIFVNSDTNLSLCYPEKML
jgi:hypothetical protein